jgi:hypothetical protein
MKTLDPVFEQRRRLLVRALGAAAAGALPAGLYAQGLFGNTPGRLPEGQSFYRLAGTVTIDDQPATMSTTVRPGSIVACGENSEAVFVVGTQAMLLRARSRLVIEPAASPNDPAAVVIAGLRLIGKVLTVSRDSGLRLHTSTATIGIRGTGWYAESAPDLTYFCTCYGDTELVANDDETSRASISAKQHDRPVYITRDGPGGEHIRNAPFINHTDQELALIEALVGRAPPFVFPRDIYNAPRRTY